MNEVDLQIPKRQVSALVDQSDPSLVFPCSSSSTCSRLNTVRTKHLDSACESKALKAPRTDLGGDERTGWG